MTKLRSALQERGLGICLRTRSYKFNGDRFWLWRGGLRQEDRTMARAAQELLKRKLVIENVALEFLPIISHRHTFLASENLRARTRFATLPGMRKLT